MYLDILAIFCIYIGCFQIVLLFFQNVFLYIKSRIFLNIHNLYIE